MVDTSTVACSTDIHQPIQKTEICPILRLHEPEPVHTVPGTAFNPETKGRSHIQVKYSDNISMARPSITPASIVVAVEEDLLVWTDGLISGTNRTYIENAKIAGLAELEHPLTIDGPRVAASLRREEHPARIVAALMSVAPGRARILQAPDEVLNMLRPGWEDEEEGDEGIMNLDDATDEELSEFIDLMEDLELAALIRERINAGDPQPLEPLYEELGINIETGKPITTD